MRQNVAKVASARQANRNTVMARDRKLLEKMQAGGLLYLYLVSLISSDSLFTEKDYKSSLEEIDFLMEILPENEIENKEKIGTMLAEGKELLERELKELENGK